MPAIAPKTYLQLCNLVVQRCGISGGPMATTVGQSAERARVIQWVDEAYTNIQELRPNWDWMTGDVTFPTVASKQFYTPSDCNLNDFASWDRDSFRYYFNTPGIRSEVYCRWLEWDAFRDTYIYGNLRVTPGTPQCISDRPSDHALALGMLPDAVGYTVVGEYYKAPSTLALDGDVPAMPARFHMLIVYLAMKSYANYEAAAEVMAEANIQYARMMRRLEADQLPPIEVGSF